MTDIQPNRQSPSAYPYPDTQEPDAARQATLRSAYTHNVAEGRAPYELVHINTLGEVEWILRERGWWLPSLLLPDHLLRDNVSQTEFLPVGAVLEHVNLRHTDFINVNLNGAYLAGVDLSGAFLTGIQLQGADLSYTDIHEAELTGANLSGASLRSANINGANLTHANLSHAQMGQTHLKGAHLNGALLHAATLYRADLSGSDLRGAAANGAALGLANLSHADLRNIDLSGADLRSVDVRQSDLRRAMFNDATQLDGIIFGDDPPYVADVKWGHANLISVDWSQIHVLTDERAAHQGFSNSIKKRPQKTRLNEWQAAVRSYRLLAVALREQGMNEEADRFAYRAQVCQRQVLKNSGWRAFGPYLWSSFLNLLAGYGYRPLRSFFAYILVIALFACIYSLLGQTTHPLTVQESIVVSMTAFHGRGFFSGQFSPADPQALAAAIEAFVGLMIEVSFIATFTQRYFGR